jgi:hypothetical protein
MNRRDFITLMGGGVAGCDARAAEWPIGAYGVLMKGVATARTKERNFRRRWWREGPHPSSSSTVPILNRLICCERLWKIIGLRPSIFGILIISTTVLDVY